MRAVWGASESSSFQGRSNASFVRMMNTLKRELNRQQDQLLIEHQDENAVSGGFSNSIQFHYLLRADTNPMDSSTVTGPSFDANEGATGSANVNFGLYENRRNFRRPGRGF